MVGTNLVAEDAIWFGTCGRLCFCWFDVGDILVSIHWSTPAQMTRILLNVAFHGCCYGLYIHSSIHSFIYSYHNNQLDHTHCYKSGLEENSTYRQSIVGNVCDMLDDACTLMNTHDLLSSLLVLIYDSYNGTIRTPQCCGVHIIA